MSTERCGGEYFWRKAFVLLMSGGFGNCMNIMDVRGQGSVGVGGFTMTWMSECSFQ